MTTVHYFQVFPCRVRSVSLSASSARYEYGALFSGVSLSGEETTDLLDISEYFTVSLNSSGGINLTPKPSLVGVKDYPTNMREIGPGTVTVNCTGTVSM
ncbi:hypothetical protein FJT64_026841 [Amphibalanus amphitrite]|uniref:Uncharacterized protein n=1 Tax=Amphibalanus amphitrite TaxID=1232801 RepID=A0A6A4W447_AMPAM|nr:hypothetical protein FJT64_026841 [Amphibalanus amphitrite]